MTPSGLCVITEKATTKDPARIVDKARCMVVGGKIPSRILYTTPGATETCLYCSAGARDTQDHVWQCSGDVVEGMAGFVARIRDTWRGKLWRWMLQFDVHMMVDLQHGRDACGVRSRVDMGDAAEDDTAAQESSLDEPEEVQVMTARARLFDGMTTRWDRARNNKERWRRGVRDALRDNPGLSLAGHLRHMASKMQDPEEPSDALREGDSDGGSVETPGGQHEGTPERRCMGEDTSAERRRQT